jgi:hypothetical protein
MMQRLPANDDLVVYAVLCFARCLQAKLYALVWARALASQMVSAELTQVRPGAAAAAVAHASALLYVAMFSIFLKNLNLCLVPFRNVQLATLNAFELVLELLSTMRNSHCCFVRAFFLA